MDDDLRTAMQSLRKPRTPPPGPPAKPTKPPRAKSKIKPKAPAKAKPKAVKPAAAASTDHVLIPEIVGEAGKEEANGISLKGQLTLMEQKFIELRLVGKLNIEDAMKLAGYEGYSPSYLYKLGGKIVQKYESLADDHRKIMRAMGYGESKIFELLIESATKAQSEMVKLTARIALARCLGLQKEVVEVQHGMNIIIRSRSASPPPAATQVEGGTRPALIRQIEHKPGPKTISITK